MSTAALKVVLGSTAAEKILATQLAFAECPSIEDAFFLQAIGVKAKSGVRENPEFIRLLPDGTIEYEMKRGADNRATHAAELHPGADLYLGVENGVGDLGFIVDMAVIAAVHGRSGLRAYATCPGAAFPREAYERARAKGFDVTTMGAELRAANPAISATDPHKSLTGTSRVQLLASGIALAVNTLCLDLDRAGIPLVG